ncbi:MAG TPA: type II secretion system protein GspG [Verrucomicrobiae bacterium]|nr:type II secretion system protein GspG [Verrucomicrobiae bacterium]
MKCTALLSLAVLILLTGCNPTDPSAQSSRPMTNDGAFGQYVGGLAKAKQDAGKTVDVASLREEIRLFQVDKGHYPASLDELVQDNYIKKVPDAPYGTKINYNPETGEVDVVNQ